MYIMQRKCVTVELEQRVLALQLAFSTSGVDHGLLGQRLAVRLVDRGSRHRVCVNFFYHDHTVAAACMQFHTP